MDIVIKNLCKSFGEKQVLKNINAVIKQEQTTCIMGQSGVGKTTLLNIMMGFVKADSGEIFNIPQLKSAVFQENRLCESFSVFSNIKMANDTLCEDVIMQHLAAVGLDKEAMHKVSTLSGGMKRRVALVRAILAQKNILFLDEPLKGLDEETLENVKNYLRENTKGLTVVMVTHQPEEAKALGAEILYIKNGAAV